MNPISRRTLFTAAASAALAKNTVSPKDIQTALKLSMAGDAARSMAARLREGRRSPIIDGRQVAFVYDGPAREVALSGVVAPDRPLAMIKLPGTTTWVSVHELAEDVKFTYVFLVDSKPLPDPWNPAHDSEGASVVAMPHYRVPRECRPEGSTPRGKMHAIEGAGVYVPQQYSGAPLPVLLVANGPAYRAALLPEMLDSLIARKRIPALIALFLESADSAVPLQKASAQWKIAGDAASCAFLGAADGGLTAFKTAWDSPDKCGRILTQSAHFSEQDAQMVRTSPPKPLRICMTLSAHDPEAVRDANHLVWGALRQQRYQFTQLEGEGFGSFDTWQQQLPRALEELWR